MALMTMIARVVDGLPLVGTMTEDEQVSFSLEMLGIENGANIFFYNDFTHSICSLEKVCLNIKTRQKCYSVNWDHTLLHDVRLKLDHICFSKSHF